MVASLRDRLQASWPDTGIEVIAIGRKIGLLTLLGGCMDAAVDASLRGKALVELPDGGVVWEALHCWNRDAKVK
jgi:hypothetical protein